MALSCGMAGAGPSVDPGILESASPADGLKRLLLLRLRAIGNHQPAVHRRMYAPVSPLLLVSALALARAEKRDAHSYLSNYAGGLDVPGLEELIALHERLPDAEMLEVLKIEDAYLGALVDLGVEELRQHRRVLADDGEPTLLDLYWTCWMVANPVYRRDPLPVQRQLVRHPNATDEERSVQWTRGFPRGVWWGMEHNSAIHNAREECEFRLNEVNAALNDALRPGGRRELVPALLVKQKVCTMLVERARRQYYWAPHEIEAYAASYRICTELAAQRRKEGVDDPWDEESGYTEWVEPFILPPHIRERLELPSGSPP